MSYYMLATFSDSFKADDTPRAAPQEGVNADFHGTNLATATPEQMEAVLANTVLGEFKTRLARVGLEYQTPKMPA
jgi:hypothetical protein